MKVKTEAGELYYQKGGTGPSLLMVHGGLVDSRSWAEQTPLAKQMQIVTPDTRNFGQSRGSLDGLTIDDLASDVLAVADDAKLDSFHLLGFSIGGMIAQTVALAAPERVSGLILVSTRYGGFTPPPSQGGMAEVRAHVERAYSAAFIAGHGEFLDGYVAMAVENEARGWDDVRGTMSGAPDLEAAAGIRCPTLVLHARGDEAIPLALGTELAAAIPGARLEVVEDTGHTMQVEQPELFNRLVAEFVAENNVEQ